MAQNIHYEIFRRRGPGGGWSLVEVRDHREDALKYAQELITGEAVCVKVVKETYNDETGDYLSLTVFEHGENKKKVSKIAQEDVPSSPCFKPDDLYSYHARKTIASLLPDFLSRHKVTVTEMGHRADLLEKLEATDTVLQHAIQRVAVAQAASGENQLTKIIRSLHELTTQAMHRVYRDAEKSRFVTVKPGGFLALAEKLAGTHEGLYLLNGSIALYLKDSKGWDDKVHRLMTMMAEANGENPGAKLLFACVDNLISEVLSGAAGLRELIGAKENHGAALMALIKLFLGRDPDDTEGREGLSALTRQFATDSLPNARTAIAERILAEIRSFKRLCPKSIEDEFKTLRRIANLVVMGVGKYLSHDDLVSAFVLRSQRLITPESLAPYLHGVPPDQKLERILFVEENVIGAENKRKLAEFAAPILSGTTLLDYYQNSKAPIVPRLQQIESLQNRVRRSGFQENQRLEIADALDKLAAALESKNRLFEAIDRKPVGYTEKAAMLLKLVSVNALTEPRLTSKARDMLLAYVSKPGFLTTYASQAAKDKDAAMAELMDNLNKAGIPPEKSLKTIAA